MKGKYFLDTNILVYAHDSGYLSQKNISESLIVKGIMDEVAVISTQVLSEFFVTITRKVEKPLAVKAAKKEIKLLGSMEIVELDMEMILLAIDLHIKNKISYWDSLIIISAQQSGCSCIYSEDLSDGQIFNNIKVINPYKVR